MPKGRHTDDDEQIAGLAAEPEAGIIAREQVRLNTRVAEQVVGLGKR